VVARIFDFRPALFELLNGFVFFFPGNHQRVMGNSRTRAFGGIEDVHLQIADLNIDLFGPAFLQLFLRRIDSPDDLSAEYFRVEDSDCSRSVPLLAKVLIASACGMVAPLDEIGW
jgi:hypothetical protein